MAKRKNRTNFSLKGSNQFGKDITLGTETDLKALMNILLLHVRSFLRVQKPKTVFPGSQVLSGLRFIPNPDGC